MRHYNADIDESMFVRAPTRDWRNEKSYAVEEMTDRQLAWEFLRRCPEYVEDYDNWAPLWFRAKAAVQTQADFKKCWNHAFAEMDQLCVKWKLSTLHGLRDPTSSIAPEFENRPPPHPPEMSELWINGKDHGHGPEPLRHHSAAAFRIYFDQPLEEQFEAIRRVVRHQERRFNFRLPVDVRRNVRCWAKKYPRYLAMLDAKAAGIPIPEIAAQYFPKANDRREAQGSVRDDMDRAEEWARFGYMDLFHLRWGKGRCGK